MALEEMFTVEIPEGALFYDASKRRQVVQLDERLRAMTMQAAADFHALIREHRTPPPVNDERCEHCSLRDQCLPAVVGREGSVHRYVQSLYAPQSMECADSSALCRSPSRPGGIAAGKTGDESPHSTPERNSA